MGEMPKEKAAEQTLVLPLPDAVLLPGLVLAIELAREPAAAMLRELYSPEPAQIVVACVPYRTQSTGKGAKTQAVRYTDRPAHEHVVAATIPVDTNKLESVACAARLVRLERIRGVTEKFIVVAEGLLLASVCAFFVG